MSIFKESTRLLSGTLFGYLDVVEGNIPLPATLRTFDLGFGTILSFDSVADLSALTFTIVGSFKGKQIQEQIEGPNAGSSTTNYFYDKIISLSASANNVNGFTVSIGSYSIFVFDSYNTTNSNNINYNNINVLVRSIAAGVDGWGQARNDAGNPIGYFVYGVSGNRPDLITTSYVTPIIINDGVGHPNNPYLTFINNIDDDINQNDIRNGYFTSTIYPYNSIIVYIAGVLQTPTFLEIAQS